MIKFLITDDLQGWRYFNSSAVRELFGENVDIDTAESAQEGYNKVLENIKTPYDVIITDLQMEEDYSPKYAGEWFVEQVQMLPSYYKTKIVIISGTYNINYIADRLGVLCIPKSTARTTLEAYKSVLL